MPWEFVALKDAPVPIKKCPHCGAEPFKPFMRGVVQRNKRKFWIGPKQPYCTLICSNCKNIVGHEYPPPRTK